LRENVGRFCNAKVERCVMPKRTKTICFSTLTFVGIAGPKDFRNIGGAQDWTVKYNQRENIGLMTSVQGLGRRKVTNARHGVAELKQPSRRVKVRLGSFFELPIFTLNQISKPAVVNFLRITNVGDFRLARMFLRDDNHLWISSRCKSDYKRVRARTALSRINQTWIGLHDARYFYLHFIINFDEHLSFAFFAPLE
jgi:hypothetical protein